MGRPFVSSEGEYTHAWLVHINADVYSNQAPSRVLSVHPSVEHAIESRRIQIERCHSQPANERNISLRTCVVVLDSNDVNSLKVVYPTQMAFTQYAVRVDTSNCSDAREISKKVIENLAIVESNRLILRPNITSLIDEMRSSLSLLDFHDYNG